MTTIISEAEYKLEYAKSHHHKLKHIKTYNEGFYGMDEYLDIETGDVFSVWETGDVSIDTRFSQIQEHLPGDDMLEKYQQWAIHLPV